MTRTVPFRRHAAGSLAATVALALGVAAIPASLIHVRSIPPTATSRGTSYSDPEGFQFGDAAIGAAGGVALSMLGLGGALVASRRRTRRSESAMA